MGTVRMLYRSVAENDADAEPGTCVPTYLLSMFRQADTRLNQVKFGGMTIAVDAPAKVAYTVQAGKSSCATNDPARPMPPRK